MQLQFNGISKHCLKCKNPSISFSADMDTLIDLVGEQWISQTYSEENSKLQNHKFKHIKRMDNNCHIPDLVQAFSYLNLLYNSVITFYYIDKDVGQNKPTL